VHAVAPAGDAYDRVASTLRRCDRVPPRDLGVQRIPPPYGAIGAEHGAGIDSSYGARVQRNALDHGIAPAASNYNVPPTTFDDDGGSAPTGCRPGAEPVGQLRRSRLGHNGSRATRRASGAARRPR
jgi:hypothetical protein